MPVLALGKHPAGAAAEVEGAGAGEGGGGGFRRGVNDVRLDAFWPWACTRTSTLTRYPGAAVAVANQTVRRPVPSARRIFCSFPAEKCATTMIRAWGRVVTMTPTLVPMLGRVRVIDAVAVRGVGVGVAEAVAVEMEVAVAVISCRERQRP